MASPASTSIVTGKTKTHQLHRKGFSSSLQTEQIISPQMLVSLYPMGRIPYLVNSPHHWPGKRKQLEGFTYAR